MLHQIIPHVYLALDSSCSRGILGGSSSAANPGLYDNLCSGGEVAITALSQSIVLISNIIRILLVLAGGLSVIFIVVGGIFFVVSAGDPGRIKRAREILTNVVAGLIIMLMAYAVVTFLANGLA